MIMRRTNRGGVTGLDDFPLSLFLTGGHPCTYTCSYLYSLDAFISPSVNLMQGRIKGIQYFAPVSKYLLYSRDHPGELSGQTRLSSPKHLVLS